MRPVTRTALWTVLAIRWTRSRSSPTLPGGYLGVYPLHGSGGLRQLSCSVFRPDALDLTYPAWRPCLPAIYLRLRERRVCGGVGAGPEQPHSRQLLRRSQRSSLWHGLAQLRCAPDALALRRGHAKYLFGQVHDLPGGYPQNSIIDIGAHYYQYCKADRQQRGTAARTFQSWATEPAGQYR